MLTGADFDPGATIAGFVGGTVLFVWLRSSFQTLTAGLTSFKLAMDAFELGAIRGLCRRWE